MKAHAFLWLTGIVLICGMPPSALFLSELGLIIAAPVWISATILPLLFIVFAAMMKVALSMTMGRPVTAHEPLPGKLLIVPTLLLTTLLVSGAVCCAYAAFSGGLQ
jgi:formate hydrogenlyase subunit 3/multisubunit Na+/H+ antiporter MnhD subunit